MGPRSHERGNEIDKELQQAIKNLLQWGRVLMNAETLSLVDDGAYPKSLQWGRVLMNAETSAPLQCLHPSRGRFNGAAFS